MQLRAIPQDLQALLLRPAARLLGVHLLAPEGGLGAFQSAAGQRGALQKDLPGRQLV